MTFTRCLYYNEDWVCIPNFLTTFSQAKFYGKEDSGMKKYFAPEVETLTFAAEETIANGSNLFNDGEFGGW